MIVGKAVGIMRKLVHPIVEQLDERFNLRFENLVVAAAIIAICFLAGMLAHIRAAKKVVSSVENNVLSHMPGYSFMKSFGADMMGQGNDNDWKPVTVRLDDSWQIGFLIDDISEDVCAVFIPDAPKPWSGTITYVTNDRIKILNITQKQAVDYLRVLGRGMHSMIKDGFDQ
ncbi:DUF502 domain-containing protein [Taibaiella soli]|nr:DUF502 domain-containing protein [Taibaiella soli]